MAIAQKVFYDRDVDKVFGLVDVGSTEHTTTVPQVANRLLCFVLRGLSTPYVIPVGYFFTRCLKNDKLHSMTMEIMKTVEELGFRVARIVTDNHQTNVALFKRLSEDGALAHAVPHPFREGDPLFLSFDPNHLIKNLRHNFLEREMVDEGQAIRGGFYLRKLFEIQSQLLLKPVRFLTRAHVEPNNLEKMKVRRAMQIFSPPVIATLQYLQENSKCHPDASEFQDCSATITFMRMIAKWYALHNIASVKPWKQQEESFTVSDDERLSWLELDSMCYVEDIQIQGGRSKRKLTKETYEATLLTTRSTVALIEYLLDHVNFRYVLTQALNSDPVESLFSSLRQFNGGNDRVDARAAVFTSGKLLKVGILQAAKTANAPMNSEAKAAVKLPIQDGKTYDLSAAISSAAKELSSELEFITMWSEPVADIELAPIVYLAGYVARACEENVACDSCKLLLQAARPAGAIYGLIRNVDDGRLRYPTMEAGGLCKLVCTFVTKVMKCSDVRGTSRLCNTLTSAILPHFTQCPALTCEKEGRNHAEDLCKIECHVESPPSMDDMGAGRNEHEIPALLELVRDVLGPQNPVLVGLSCSIDLSEGTTGNQQVLSCDAAEPGPSGQQTTNTGTDSTDTQSDAEDGQTATAAGEEASTHNGHQLQDQPTMNEAAPISSSSH
ncbi:uncharacterized protein LOC144120337 [Amblyomma americanum]